MTNILIVDDMAIFRDPISACLRQAGFDTRCAADGQEALGMIHASKPDLLLLDVAMPVMDGLTLLKRIRSEPAIANLPVILLTGRADKGCVCQAAELGVREYLLKSEFSVSHLLVRINKLLHSRDTSAPVVTPVKSTASVTLPAAHGPTNTAAKPVRTANAGSQPSASQKPEPPVPALSRGETLQRVHHAMDATSLSGIVAHVIHQAASPNTDAAHLALLISRDPNLTAKVLHVANSALYGSSRAVITSITEAIKHVGFSTVRNIAATVGIIEAMPSGSDKEFDPIRSWQHAFATAQLCEQLAKLSKSIQPDVAYLLGLCHDLCTVLIHTYFGNEYRHILKLHRDTGKPISELFLTIFNVSHTELTGAILDGLGLPEIIRQPIAEIQDAEAIGGVPLNETARLLLLADRYTNGMLLASSMRSPIQGFTQAECRKAVGAPNPPTPNRQTFRSEILGITQMISGVINSHVGEPLLPESSTSVFLARQGQLSSFDPIEAALDSLGQVTVQNRLPTPGELFECDALVVAACTDTEPGFAASDIAAARQGSTSPLLWLVGRRASGGNGAADADLHPLVWPIPLETLTRILS